MKALPQLKTEVVAVADLKAHPKNYRRHPKEQIEHLAESIRRNGFYRNVVLARDGTVLAGHGAIEAAKIVGLAQVPVMRLDVGPNSAEALKVLAGDNRIADLAEDDNLKLVAILKELGAGDDALLGTGYDDLMMQRLLQEGPIDAQLEWGEAGMPDYTQPDLTSFRRIVVHFKNQAAVDRFAKAIGQRLTDEKFLWFPRADQGENSEVDKRARRKK